MNTDVDTELFLFLEAEISSDEGCEHSQHKIRLQAHKDSETSWYVTIAPCRTCNDNGGVYIYCDKYVQTILSLMDDDAKVGFACFKCRDVARAKDVYVNFEKRT